MTRTSDHFDGRRFFNPTGPEVLPFSAVPKMLREPKAPWPVWIDEPPQVPPGRVDEAAVVTFVGHSTFLIQTAAGNLITDPIYSMRAGPFNLLGPRRVRRPAVNFQDLPAIAVVLLSHSHYDHCDRPTLRRLARRFDPLVVTPLGNAPLLRGCGFRRIEELDWWEGSTSSPVPVVATPAHHFSARTPFDRNRALWSGFMIAAGERTIYFAADTAYVPIFSDIRQRLGAPDLALLPIGAYEPRWFMHAVHMNPEEAVRAHVELGSRESIAMHYGTFQLTTEAIDAPLRALEQARVARNVTASQFRTIAFGESVRLS
ncbi:MAG TPA: MBL fold metallo-hydrolase [Vicinamibacterales bacterium]